MAKPTAVLVCRDLIFEAKIQGTCDALGIELAVVASIGEVSDACTVTTRLVLLDLADPSTSLDAMRELRNSLSSDIGLLAFGSHVDIERLREARTAGCDPVLPRSEFAATLPTLLQRACE
ncbi:MAG: response regulator [Planctomycetota bacterium]